MIAEKSVWNNPLRIRKRYSRRDRAGQFWGTIYSSPSLNHSGNILVENIGHSLDVKRPPPPIDSYIWMLDPQLVAPL